MVRVRREYVPVFWAGVGILLASVAANRLFASELVNYPVLYGYLEQGWQQRGDWDGLAVAKVVVLRAMQTVAVALLCRGRFKRLACRMIPALIGGGTGLSIVLLTWSRGAVGILLFLALWFPHGLCYLAVWGLLLLRCAMDCEVQTRSFWSAVLAALAAGILLEMFTGARFLTFF